MASLLDTTFWSKQVGETMETVFLCKDCYGLFLVARQNLDGSFLYLNSAEYRTAQSCGLCNRCALSENSLMNK
jgi:hypothetical protein